MLTKNNVNICDNCILLFNEALTQYLYKDIIEKGDKQKKEY